MYYVVFVCFIVIMFHIGHKKKMEEQKRRNTICDFSDGISEEQFGLLAHKAGKHIKRLTDLYVKGPVIYGSVRSQSGITEWNFKIDFNDYGHITGRYWIRTDNDDSSIPDHIADNVKKMIKEFVEDN